MRTEFKDNMMKETVFDSARPYSKTIPNLQIMFYAVSGHGKSMTIEAFVEKMHKCGYLVIVLTEKFIHRLEFGFVQFEPRLKFHVDHLNEQNKPIEKHDAIVHAVWSFNQNPFWKKRLPPMKFFTININDVHEDLWSILFEQPTKSLSIKAIVSAQRELKPFEGLRDLIRIAISKIKDKKVAGSQQNIDEIHTILDPIVDAGFIMPARCNFNLDIDTILYDQKNYHIFHYGFLPEGHRKSEYFLVSCIQELIIKRYSMLKQDIRKSKKLKPVLWVIQESNVFFPDKIDKYYINKCAEMMMNVNKQIRSLGMSSVADAQNVFKTNEDYRTSMTDSYYGKLDPSPDVERLGKINRYNARTRNRLQNMPKNHYKKKGDTEERVFLFPSHRHCEEGEDYHVIYSENYNSKMRKHLDVYEYLEKMRKDEYDRHMTILKEEIKSKKKKDMKKQLKELEKLEKSEKEKQQYKDKIKSLETEQHRELCIKLYKESKLNPDQDNPKSWVQLGKENNISDHTAKTYANKGRVFAL